MLSFAVNQRARFTIARTGMATSILLQVRPILMHENAANVDTELQMFCYNITPRYLHLFRRFLAHTAILHNSDLPKHAGQLLHRPTHSIKPYVDDRSVSGNTAIHVEPC